MLYKVRGAVVVGVVGPTSKVLEGLKSRMEL
jgi:hypothetical protein